MKIRKFFNFPRIKSGEMRKAREHIQIWAALTPLVVADLTTAAAAAQDGVPTQTLITIGTDYLAVSGCKRGAGRYQRRSDRLWKAFQHFLYRQRVLQAYRGRVDQLTGSNLSGQRPCHRLARRPAWRGRRTGRLGNRLLRGEVSEREMDAVPAAGLRRWRWCAMGRLGDVSGWPNLRI